MDVNGIGQNNINLTGYNSNVSEYTGSDTEAAVRKVQQPEENNMQNAEYSKKDLDDALNKINNFLKDEHTHAEYAFHKDFSNTLMIKIIDDNTKQVILEIPPQKILDMVASMCRQVGLFDRKV